LHLTRRGDVPDEQHRISNGELVRLVLKHDKDLYDGDRQAPGLTVRMAIVEKAVEAIMYYARWILLTAMGILIVAILHLVVK
jgi:hypothetical protein